MTTAIIEEAMLLKKVDELWPRRRGSRTVEKDELTKHLVLLFEEQLRAKSKYEMDDFFVAVFTTRDMPFSVLRHACQTLMKQADRHLTSQYLIRVISGALVQDPELRYNLDIILASVPADHYITIPASVRAAFHVHFMVKDEWDLERTDGDHSTTSDEELQASIAFYISLKGKKVTCRQCLRYALVFWRDTYPHLRPLWMKTQLPRPTGLHPIQTYQAWFAEDQTLYLSNVGEFRNTLDPFTMEPVDETPFFFMLQTSKPSAPFHHLFDIFMLHKHFCSTEKDARPTNPYDRSVLDQKNETACLWQLRHLRAVFTQTLRVRTCTCTPTPMQCTTES